MATRRDFLKTTAALTLAGCASREGAPKGAPVVDTHLHCFAGPDDPRFPYHARAPYRPDAPATPERLIELMDGAGVDYAVVVHPEPYQDDHRYLEYCLSVGKGRLKGTCLFFCDRPGSMEQMPALVKRLPIVAARIHAYAPERLPPFGKPELRAMWKQIADLGLIVQLHFEPRHAPGFEPLIREFPGTTVIIDHLGRPLQGTPEEHAVVLGWAKFPNTVIKLSAFQANTQYPHRDIAPAIRALADAYGPDRMIYGGGFEPNATAESYRATRLKAASFISHFSNHRQAMVLGGTAARLFRFGT
jgi:predicted TIM-barrel fold metal-dependent hydrolase